VLELTVSMPARNAERYIGDALRSVLTQEGIDFDVIVVDDASTDDTARIASSTGDARLRVIRASSHRGIGWCHNQVLGATSAPYIAHVDADDVILPGALRAMVDALRANHHAAQSYCDFYTTDASGYASAETVARCRRDLAAARRPPIDYGRQLLLYGMVVNHLRTYRRDALLSVGGAGFDETLPWAVDYEMALRLASDWSFAHVPQLLYAKRILPTGASERLRARRIRFWAMRYRLARRLLRARGGRLCGRGAARVRALLWLGLFA
jgi:glycosyltransferase involved in cell wall biosynthesis